MSQQPLIQVSVIDKGQKIGVVNYADMVALDKDQKIVAIRFGGYPETVQSMSDALVTGCELILESGSSSLKANSKDCRNYERRITKDGVYAEGLYYLKDDIPRSYTVGDSDNEQTVKGDSRLYFFCHDEEELFSALDSKLSVPLIPEFKDYFLSELKARDRLRPLRILGIGQNFEGWTMQVPHDEKEIAEIITDGLRDGRIAIPGSDKTGSAVFRNIKTFTQYLKEFGVSVAKRIKQCFPPRYIPADEPISPALTEVNRYVMAHAKYALFDAQLQAAEAIRRQLETDRMAILVAECGTGKTKIGAAAVYAYQHSSPQRKTATKAFNVVVCPSHITEKWVRELHETIPHCFAQPITSLSDVDKLYAYYQTYDQTVYAVLSKETARNGYMRSPSVTWNRLKKGFACPYCGDIQQMQIFDDGTDYLVNADADFFLNENGKNHKCQCCGAPLWGMLNPQIHAPERNEWVRIGGYGFIHRRFARDAWYQCKSNAIKKKIEEVMREPDGVFIPRGAYNRYPLSAYIKRTVRHIDALIVDELHQYSGESAQGQSMAELAGIADKVIGMTATLVNGYAKGIFYLLFRLKPHLMLLDGHCYSSPRDFCTQYGVTEQLYEVDATQYNSTTKVAKRKVREKFLPGISPLVYSRFLLENAVFLTLADMGKELPDYEEIPIGVRAPEPVIQEYARLEMAFRRMMIRDRRIGNRIMSSYINLLTAYPDQPYDHEPIYDPTVKDEKIPLIVPADTGTPEEPQAKDEQLLPLIERKIAAGERVILYVAWIRLDTRKRLQKLLRDKGISSAILDATVPTVKREAWVDKRLQEGIQVLIVDPALVETGLDLNAFTTLIFYNIAYNLYVFRQASRRSWRINQTAPKVEVYMFYYKDTMQQRALRLMASKLSAATVIEGNISDEGLAAMSNCEDMTTQLAKELMQGLKANEDEIAVTFRKMAIHNEKSAAPVPAGADADETEPAVVIPMPAIPRTKPTDKRHDTGQLSLLDLLAS